MKPLVLLTVFVTMAAGTAAVTGQARTPRAGAADRIGRQLLGIGPRVEAPSGADAFFDDSTLHEIRLDINSKDWETLKTNYRSNEYYPCDFTWGGQKVRNVGIRSRGTGSRSGIKPGLRVDFDRYTSDQKFLGLKSFVLRNNTQDASNLNERLSMLLFRRLGVQASREAHTKLYVNGEYAGLYSIVESVDKSFLARHFGEDTGYLFKYDYPADAAPYYFEDRGSDPGQYVPLPFQPETHEADPRPEFIVDFVQTLNQAGDASFRTDIAEFLDLGRFVRQVAIENYLGDYDGVLGQWGMNNFYFYRFDTQKRFAIIPWDKSQAFLGGFNYSIWRNITDVPGPLQNRLMARALAYPDLYDLYLDTLLECVASADDQTGFSDGRGWLEHEILREYEQIRDAALADPDKPYTNAQFEQAVSDLGVFSRRRGEAVTREVNGSRRR